MNYQLCYEANNWAHSNKIHAFPEGRLRIISSTPASSSLDLSGEDANYVCAGTLKLPSDLKSYLISSSFPLQLSEDLRNHSIRPRGEESGLVKAVLDSLKQFEGRLETTIPPSIIDLATLIDVDVYLLDKAAGSNLGQFDALFSDQRDRYKFICMDANEGRRFLEHYADDHQLRLRDLPANPVGQMKVPKSVLKNYQAKGDREYERTLRPELVIHTDSNL